MTPTHTYAHIKKNSVHLRVPVAWGVKKSTNSSWMAPLAAFIVTPWIFDCWKEEKKGNNACVHADAVAFISVVVKTDLHVLYLVTTRQKKLYLRVKPAAKYGNHIKNHIIKSDWRISRENISGLIRKATYLVLDSDMRQHTQHYMGPLKRNTSCLTSHYLIPSSDAT